jgi:hypothetical protein
MCVCVSMLSLLLLLSALCFLLLTKVSGHILFDSIELFIE